MGGPETQDQLLYSVDVAGRVLGIGRTTIYELMTEGQLDSVHIGRCRRITRASLEDYVQRLVATAKDGP